MSFGYDQKQAILIARQLAMFRISFFACVTSLSIGIYEIGFKYWGDISDSILPPLTVGVPSLLSLRPCTYYYIGSLNIMSTTIENYSYYFNFPGGSSNPGGLF